MTEGERARRRRFDTLFESYSADIVAYCGWRADSASDAQDAAAEVFLVAWRRLDALPEGDAARAWLYATARRVLANQRRASRRAALYERLALDTASAAEAERSGTAVVRITHDDAIWTGSTIRWHGQDLSLTSDAPRRFGRAGSEFRVVDGSMYGIDDGVWVVVGSPDSIDPGSGTTPDEYLAAVREDVGGATLRRITDGMTDRTTRQLADGATVFSGTVAAGLIARETGFKEGRSIRVLPFGYVAHDEAANPDAPLHAAITVGADGVVREIAVTWGTSASAWTYTVTYSDLGETPAPVAPADARPLRERLRAERNK